MYTVTVAHPPAKAVSSHNAVGSRTATQAPQAKETTTAEVAQHPRTREHAPEATSLGDEGGHQRAVIRASSEVLASRAALALVVLLACCCRARDGADGTLSQREASAHGSSSTGWRSRTSAI